MQKTSGFQRDQVQSLDSVGGSRSAESPSSVNIVAAQQDVRDRGSVVLVDNRVEPGVEAWVAAPENQSGGVEELASLGGEFGAFGQPMVRWLL